MYGYIWDLHCWWTFSHPTGVQYLRTSIFLSVPTWESYYLGMLHLKVVWRELPPTSRTDNQPPLFLLNSLCLPEWYLAQVEVACDGSSPIHVLTGPLGKELSRTIFPLPDAIRLSWGWFSGVCGALTKTVSIRTQFSAEEVSIAACTWTTARAGSAVICCWTCCSVVPKQAVSYNSGKVLQQNHQGFLFPSAA